MVVQCADSFAALSSVGANCPKACTATASHDSWDFAESDKDGELRACKPGEHERAPESCGTESCRALLAQLKDEAETLGIGIATCTGQWCAAGRAHGRTEPNLGGPLRRTLS